MTTNKFLFFVFFFTLLFSNLYGQIISEDTTWYLSDNLNDDSMPPVIDVNKAFGVNWTIVKEYDAENKERLIGRYISPFSYHSLDFDYGYRLVLNNVGSFEYLENEAKKTKKGTYIDLLVSYENIYPNIEISISSDSKYDLYARGVIYIDSLGQLLLDLSEIEYKQLIPFKSYYESLRNYNDSTIYFDDFLEIERLPKKKFSIEKVDENHIKLTDVKSKESYLLFKSSYYRHIPYFNWLFINEFKGINTKVKAEKGVVMISVYFNFEKKTTNYRIIHRGTKKQNKIAIKSAQKVVKKYILDYVKSGDDYAPVKLLLEYPYDGSFITKGRRYIIEDAPIIKVEKW